MEHRGWRMGSDGSFLLRNCGKTGSSGACAALRQ
jgi:hypothetical protein